MPNQKSRAPQALRQGTALTLSSSRETFMSINTCCNIKVSRNKRFAALIEIAPSTMGCRYAAIGMETRSLNAVTSELAPPVSWVVG